MLLVAVLFSLKRIATSKIQVVIHYVYFVWAQEAAYSHTMFHHADIEWARGAAYSSAVFEHTAHIGWAQETYYR